VSYIKVEKDLPDDPRLLELATSCYDAVLAWLTSPDCNARSHASRHALLGVLVDIWKYADTYLQSDESLPVTLQGLAAAIGAPVELLQRLPERWLKVRSDGTVELPRYIKKNRLVGKDLRRSASERREADRVRQQRHRAKRKQQEQLQTVTQRDNDGRHASTGTGTGTSNPIPVPAVTALARAFGPLAPRPENGRASAHAAANGSAAAAPTRPKRQPKTQAMLKSDVRKLTAGGLDPPTIARTLAQHGVTESDVNRWLAEGASP
jgi:hypothetical protein